MEELRFEENSVLFGNDPTEGIVAAELAGRFVRLLIRDESGVRFKDDPFHPFILLENSDIISGCGISVEMEPLAGNASFRFLARFRDWHDCLAARDFLAKTTGISPSHPSATYLFLNDPVHQHLLLTGKTLFKGMEFDGLRRLALDIETDCAPGHDFSNPSREEDRIVSVALMEESGWSAVLSGHELSERQILERLTTLIRERDPDVIEGHNIFRFDLEYIRIRAARHGVKLAWGRDGSEPHFHPSRFTVAERIVDYPRCDIYGRSIIDTYFLVLLYDVSARELESYGLKQVAAHFGLAAPDRTYLAGEEIAKTYREQPELLARYNLDDVRETLAVSRLLSFPYFLQTRIFPYSYQNIPVRGNATRINALFLREYLRQRHSIPRPGSGGEFAGGFTAIFEQGVVGPVVHCDVASLYPSILLSYKLSPEDDELGLFLPLLADLCRFRLAAKKLAREATDPSRHEYFQALQRTFKVLINSFYGYLGSALHNFSDPRLAGEVTRIGRELVQKIIAELQVRGARPVEVDTDGIFFIPPRIVASPETENALVREISALLPEGIDLEADGRYCSMFSYKMKNYALLDYQGRVSLTGSGLRSRGMERYLREFLHEMIILLLQGDDGKIEQIASDYIIRIREHRFDINWLARTETLNESPATYRQKVRQGKRNPSAAYELALASGRDCRAGDQVSYYVTGSAKGVAAYQNCKLASDFDPGKPDVNVPYYIDKLQQLKRRFSSYAQREPSLFD
ncbi:MAG: DNA polymerase II [Geobacter sp.]|nr:DNA polymerase II [Geobacter sp.]